jgi:ribosome recycling factor
MDTKQELQKKTDEILKYFKDDIGSVRGSRPSPALVEDIQVEYYGQKMPVKQLGSIMVVPPREIQVSVWDGSIVNAIAKAIGEKLNVNASPDGNTIHVNLPSLTQERREELSKAVKAKTEEARIKSRAARDEVKKDVAALEKAGEITEDDRFALNEEIQKIIDAFNKNVDDLLEKKLAEIQEQ